MSDYMMATGKLCNMSIDEVYLEMILHFLCSDCWKSLFHKTPFTNRFTKNSDLPILKNL